MATCADCRYARTMTVPTAVPLGSTGGSIDVRPSLRCCYNSPTLQPGSVQAVWPVVLATDWCGDYQASP